jgi:hypothetical protein
VADPDGFSAMFRVKLESLVRADDTRPPDQIIHYPAVSNDSRYTFSLFAFATAQFPETFTVLCKFIRGYYQHGYLSNLRYVGDRIAQDQQSLS